MATKRMRMDMDEWDSDSDDSRRTTAESPASKAQRLSSSATSEASSSANILCTLPPTCHPPHNRPSIVANVQELESHYSKYHAFVCQESHCGAVFPGQRLLELHQTECHDPIAYERMTRGEKIFACHLEECPKVFGTPKSRRMHLIQAHHFPKEYFFAVTNKGVGGLLKKWGEGASMVRGTWKHREDEQSEFDMTGSIQTEETDGQDEEVSSEDPIAIVADESGSTLAGSEEVGTLIDSMSSLALVPQTLRFGRGARKSRPFRKLNIVPQRGLGTSKTAEEQRQGSERDEALRRSAAMEGESLFRREENEHGPDFVLGAGFVRGRGMARRGRTSFRGRA